jgi:thymidylate synthase ThyX
MEAALPRVTLRNSFAQPFDSAIAAARTCYSPRIVTPAEITEKQRASIGQTTFQGGHHTVYQHPHFEFGLENVSRHFVWNFLHSHPFYNSEQQSQRYVRLDQAQAFLPPLEGAAREVYTAAVDRAWEAYRELGELLKPVTLEVLSEIWELERKGSPQRTKRVKLQAGKKAIEIARYVLPVAAATTMVHTISGIVLHRLWRMCRTGDTPYETAQVAGEMVARVKELDPQFFDRIGQAPLAEDEAPEPALAGARCDGRAAAEFDRLLGGRVSRLVDYSPNAERVAAQAVRFLLGRCEEDLSDDEALRLALDPAANPYRLEIMNVAVHAPLMRALHHAHYTFAKKISHTADSQDQRHRMVPGSRPLLPAYDSPAPDYVTPMLVRQHTAARVRFEQAMEDAWTAKQKLLTLGVKPEFAQYLLPNAVNVRLVESGALIHLIHKWTMRTCFNAQEEIYFASMEELEQVRAVHPRLGRFLGPPCYIRSGNAYPVCTEGSHFCGVRVWKDFPNVERRI